MSVTFSPEHLNIIGQEAELMLALINLIGITEFQKLFDALEAKKIVVSQNMHADNSRKLLAASILALQINPPSPDFHFNELVWSSVREIEMVRVAAQSSSRANSST